MRVFNIPKENWEGRARWKASEWYNFDVLLTIDEILSKNDFFAVLRRVIFHINHVA